MKNVFGMILVRRGIMDKRKIQGKRKHLCSLDCPYHPVEKDICRLYSVVLKRRMAFAGKGGALYSRCKECFHRRI
jgi:hypothetical protein